MTEWVPAAGGSDASGFEVAYLACLPQLQRFVAGLGFAPHDAADILQDVYLAAAERPGAYLGPAAAQRWLFRVALNEARREGRRRRRYGEVVADARQTAPAVAEPSPDITPAEKAAVRQALADLDDAVRVPLVLRYFCELDATEIGAVLDLPPATVRSRLRTGRLKLADRLREVNLGDA